MFEILNCSTQWVLFAKVNSTYSLETSNQGPDEKSNLEI